MKDKVYIIKKHKLLNRTLSVNGVKIKLFYKKNKIKRIKMQGFNSIDLNVNEFDNFKEIENFIEGFFEGVRIVFL